MNAIIIDDNEKAANELKRQLKDYPDIQVVGMAQNSFDGLALADDKRPDVIFLDVEMPGITGLDFLDRVPWVKEGRCRIVMFTAHDKYALPAMRKQAFDVLLKPIDPDELAGVVARLRAQKKNDVAKEEKKVKKEKDSADKLILWTNSVDFKLVKKSDIGIIQHNADQRCWEAIVANYPKPMRMKRNVKAEDLTDLGKEFVQVNQKYIINMSYLIEVVDNRCSFFPPFEKIDYVTVGRMFRKKLTDKFLNL